MRKTVLVSDSVLVRGGTFGMDWLCAVATHMRTMKLSINLTRMKFSLSSNVNSTLTTYF